MSISGAGREKGETQICVNSGKGTQRIVPKDWKFDKNMHAVAADNRDPSWGGGWPVETQLFTSSVWTGAIEE